MGEPLALMTVKIADTQLFKDVLGVFKEIGEDERIEESIREEYIQKLLDVTEANQSERE